AVPRHEQQFAIGVVEKPCPHARVDGVQMYAHAREFVGAAIAGPCAYSVDKVGGRFGRARRAPPQRLGRSGRFLEAAGPAMWFVGCEAALTGRSGPDAIQPRSPVF